MRKIQVNAGKGYEILIEEGILPDCGLYIKKVKNAKKVCIISDSNVSKLYGKTVKDSLAENGFEVLEFVFIAGEERKTTETVVSMVEFMAENEMTREDLVVALGGGVCGDMAGFASAIYLRGIDFVQIPTSLLAQVDSSVGGKTAVDLPQGKNLCGAFHQPILVIIDPCTLKSLSTRYFSDGMAEAIKMGCIKSESLFEKIAKNNLKEDLIDIIYECVALKAGVVERDEKEHGERALLNFGHTAGHAIEKLHNFSSVTHGEAVGVGMLIICEAAERANLTEKGTKARIEEVLKTYNLPVCTSDSTGDIVEAMNADKKRTGSSIKFVFISKIGNGFINPIEYKNIERFFGV